MNSHSPHLHRAVERARWLALLATALDEAGKLMLDLCDLGADPAEAAALADHIDALRSEVDLFRRQRLPSAGEFHPNWIS